MIYTTNLIKIIPLLEFKNKETKTLSIFCRTSHNHNNGDVSLFHNHIYVALIFCFPHLSLEFLWKVWKEPSQCYASQIWSPLWFTLYWVPHSSPPPISTWLILSFYVPTLSLHSVPLSLPSPIPPQRHPSPDATSLP